MNASIAQRLHRLVYLLGIVFLILFISTAFLYFVAGDYRRSWIELRIRNFIKIPELSDPSNIYSLPQGWINEISADYLPKAPKYPADRFPFERKLDANHAYRAALVKSGLTESARDQFAVLSKNGYNCPRNSLESCLQVSFLPARPPGFSVGSDSTILDRNGIAIPIKMLRGKRNKILIAIHGRGGTPEGVVCNYKDYANCFGKYWNERGYSVYAPAVESSNIEWSVPRLNLDSTASDLAKIQDLIKYIQSIHGSDQDMELVVAGISYGATLSEFAALLFPEIDGLVSIGGEGRYIYGESEFSLPRYGSFNPSRSSLRNGMVFTKIRNTIPIIISTGLVDAGSFNDDGYGKFRMHRQLKSSRNIAFHFFNGGHEADPSQEYIKYYAVKARMKNVVLRLP